MATGSPGTNGVWQYGEDDSEATFSALLNKAASTTDTAIGVDRGRLTALEADVTALEAAGRIVQVITATKTDTASIASGTFTDISGLSVSITPKSATNKILVLTRLNFGVSGDEQIKARVMRFDSNVVDLVAFARFSSNLEVRNYAGIALDSPASTSATTYKVQWLREVASTAFLNRRGLDAGVQTYSSITVMEVVA
jgi:hypothetical protein